MLHSGRLALFVSAMAIAPLAIVGRTARGADPAAAGKSDSPEAEPSAAKLLKARGLGHIAGAWCLKEETDLHEQLAALEGLERRLADRRLAVDQMLEQNENYRVQLSKAEQEEKRLRGLLPAAKAGTPQRKQLDAELKTVTAAIPQLRQLYVPPDRLGVGQQPRQLCLELVNLRTEMAIRLLPLRAALEKLTTRYDLMREDAGIAAAIVATGTGDPLGPARNMHDAAKTLDRLSSVVFPDWLPVYRDGNLYRVTALVNDKQPLTFSFGDTSQRTVILQSQAEAAGLKWDDAAPRVKYRVAAGRDEMVRVVKIPRLRFGRVVLTNVEAGILPPEAADVGARIGPGAFERHGVHLDAEHLLLYIPGS
jgi:hypothetical protein